MLHTGAPGADTLMQQATMDDVDAVYAGGSAVALQGSIDTFALDDVLRLVASTGKTGRLSLCGSRGEGELVVRDGLVLDGAVSTDERVGDLYELVFELLRFDDGEFVFDAVAIDGLDDAEPVEVEGLIEGASGLLAEWRDIEAVVSGPFAAVTLVAEPPGGTVKIEPAQWRLIASIGAGAGVGELSERLDASHLATGRLLRSLVEAGLVSVSDSPVPPVALEEPVAAFAEPVPVIEADTSFAPFSTEPAVWGDEPESFNGNGGNGNGHGSVDHDVLFDSVHESGAVSVVEVADHDDVYAERAPVDAADFARRLAELPPRAAKAVAAAARATSVEERQAALADLDGTGEEVDHEVLLQLLGPVEG
jgi:DNA-binding transcriptional ArsR family regulator